MSAPKLDVLGSASSDASHALSSETVTRISSRNLARRVEDGRSFADFRRISRTGISRCFVVERRLTVIGLSSAELSIVFRSDLKNAISAFTKGNSSSDITKVEWISK